ncbi:MAG: YjcZ family sporulation protein [Nitrososphaeraceae archaeon]
MKSVITLGIVLTFSILFTSSSGLLKGQVFASIEEEGENSYYPDKYHQYDRESSFSAGSPGVLSGNILKGIDKEQLKEIEDKLFQGIDKERLLNNAINLLHEYDFDIGALNEYLLEDSWGYGGAFVLILVLFILLVIIGAGVGWG